MMPVLISHALRNIKNNFRWVFFNGADQCLDARTLQKFGTISFKHMMPVLISHALRNIKNNFRWVFLMAQMNASMPEPSGSSARSHLDT
jgi:hypothetical protein